MLRDRREYIDKKNLNLCEKGYNYEGDNLKILQVICYCPIKVNMTEEPSINSVINTTNISVLGHNFNVLKCYKLTFSYNGQKYNYFSELFLLLLAINISLIVIIKMNLEDNLNNLIIFCKEFIYKKNNYNNEFIKLRNNYLNGSKDLKLKQNVKRFINEKILENSPTNNKVNNNKHRLNLRNDINFIFSIFNGC